MTPDDILAAAILAWLAREALKMRYADRAAVRRHAKEMASAAFATVVAKAAAEKGEAK